jgi:hypothetical protein
MMSEIPVCDLCGATPCTAAPTGTYYCAKHVAGKILLPGEWAMLTDRQQQRRVQANQSLTSDQMAAFTSADVNMEASYGGE